MLQYEIRTTHFIAGPSEETWHTYTMPLRLSDMLEEMEDRLGPRDREWTVLGIEYAHDGPYIWYPFSRKHIMVTLGTDALTRTDISSFQLAHEAVHLLAPEFPSLKPFTTCLEEGLAAWLAYRYVGSFFPAFCKTLLTNGKERDSPYTPPRLAVTELLSRDRYAVRKLREVEPAFHK